MIEAPVVLESRAIAAALDQLAAQVLAKHPDSENLAILGIPTRGVPLARRIAALLSESYQRPVMVGALDITMYRDDLRSQPTREVGPTSLPVPVDNAQVLLVDDVLFSGRTVRAALAAISDLGRPRSVELAVLIDRGGRQLPIQPDYVGQTLPTPADQQVRVQLREVDQEDAVRVTLSGRGP